MSRRQELENIIIGTLLDSTPEVNYFEECRCSITEDMFLDEVNRRVYVMISEMNKKGQYKTDPLGIFDVYGEKVADIVPRMCELCTDYSMVYKKCQYNESQWMDFELYGKKARYTDVSFGDYVSSFTLMVFRDGEREELFA